MIGFRVFHLVLRGKGGGVKSSIHFHCLLHATTKRKKKKGGGGVKIASKIAYELNGRPLLLFIKSV